MDGYDVVVERLASQAQVVMLVGGTLSWLERRLGEAR